MFRIIRKLLSSFVDSPTMRPKKYEPIPQTWLREILSIEELAEIYREMFYVRINERGETIPKDTDSDDRWNELISLYSDDCEIRRFNSGFCQGAAILKNGVPIADIVWLHYRRGKNSGNARET